MHTTYQSINYQYHKQISDKLPISILLDLPENKKKKYLNNGIKKLQKYTI